LVVVNASAANQMARDDLAAHRRNFAAGDKMIRDGGQLTPLGTELIEAARSYMAAA
jgi:hypothetical protein